jgi:hypothetical protein
MIVGSRNVWEPHEDNHLVFDTHISGNNVPIDAQIVADDTSEKCSFTASTKMLGHDPSIPVKSIEGVMQQWVDVDARELWRKGLTLELGMLSRRTESWTSLWGPSAAATADSTPRPCPH